MLQFKRLREKESTVAEEIVVQRMSVDVSGKQQKYTRIAPQECVPFEQKEITIANIKNACQKHFRLQIEKHVTYWLESAGHLMKR